MVCKIWLHPNKFYSSFAKRTNQDKITSTFAVVATTSKTQFSIVTSNFFYVSMHTPLQALVTAVSICSTVSNWFLYWSDANLTVLTY